MGVIVWIVRLLLAVVFAIAGIAKLADPAGARKSLVDFGVPAFLGKPLALLIPLAELACAVALIPQATFLWGAGGLLGMLVVFSAGMGVVLAGGRRPDCHCFGQLHSSPIGWKTLARNGVLAAMAGFVWWQGPQNASAVWDLSRLETGLLAVAVAFGILLALQAWTIFHFFRQNGRLLLRVDALEAKVGKSDAATAGLPRDTPAPGFSLKGLDDETVTLDSLRERGKPLVLIFAEPGCGACETLFPEIAQWQQELAERLSIVMISRGKVEANRNRSEKHGLQNVLLQTDREVAQAYQCAATPAAVLIQEGKIVNRLSEGPDAIRTLIVRATLPPPVKKGDPVPSYRLPDLDGKELDLSTLRGRHTLLLFWNPTCGFCQGMLADLKTRELHLPMGAPDLLVISTGSVEANRAQGFRSRVLLDQHFAAATLFGAGGTPGAVMIDEEGRLASDVGMGSPAVFEMLGSLPPVPARG